MEHLLRNHWAAALARYPLVLWRAAEAKGERLGHHHHHHHHHHYYQHHLLCQCHHRQYDRHHLLCQSPHHHHHCHHLYIKSKVRMETKEEEEKKKGVSQAFSSTWQVVDVGHELRCRPSTCILHITSTILHVYYMYNMYIRLLDSSFIIGLVGLHEASCKKRWTWFGFPLHDGPWFRQYHLVILSASGGYTSIWEL